mgnify:CR=1 FL=1
MNLENFRLTGKTVLITGGAGMLGIQHAAAILEADGSVIITDLKKKDLDEASEILFEKFCKLKIHLHPMDVTDEKSIQATLNILSRENIRVDILINNAAIDPKVNAESGILESSRLENFELDQWNLQVNVGLTGAFLCAKYFGSAMAQDGQGGVIINIASDLSVISPDQRLYRTEGIENHLQPVKPVTYSVIKSGLIGLTKYLATYWADKGVRCNALSPGGVYSGQGGDFVNKLTSLIPAGRMAHADEYRSSLQYLCSDASSYMNGQNIVVDGGRSVW